MRLEEQALGKPMPHHKYARLGITACITLTSSMQAYSRYKVEED